MGIWRTPYVMPSDHRRLTHDDFTMLILRIFHEQIGHPPVTIASVWVTQQMHQPVGMVYFTLTLDIPKEITQFSYKLPIDRYDPLTGEKTGHQEMTTIWYRGDDRDAIARALSLLPYNREDVNVTFDDWGGPSFVCSHTATGYCFFDAYDTNDEMHEITTYVCELSGGLRNEEDVYFDPIMPLLEEYYGPNMRVAFSCS